MYSNAQTGNGVDLIAYTYDSGNPSVVADQTICEGCRQIIQNRIDELFSQFRG